MDSEQMAALMRRIEKTVPPELADIVIPDRREDLPDGTRINHYIIPDGRHKPGYLWIHHNPATMELLAAEMNVNFRNLIGLNRSPIGLRIICNHILKYLP